MAGLTSRSAAEVAEACRAAAREAAEAFRRAFDLNSVTIAVGDAAEVVLAALPEGFGGPGQVLVLTSGSEAMIFALPESSGLLPSWVEAPDATGQSRLSTLAQELGMILLPEPLVLDDFQAGRVKSLHGGLARGGICDGAAMVPLEITADGKKAPALLAFPATKPGSVIGGAAAMTQTTKASRNPAAKTAAGPAPDQGFSSPVQHRRGRIVSVDQLPAYSRSLLRIKVPVVVTLAHKRQCLRQIMELGPGSIIQFDKSCDEMLELDVGGRSVAKGEAVKVGDKFGLRINAITMPEERFEPVRGPEQPGARLPR